MVREERIEALLGADVIDLRALAQATWHGIVSPLHRIFCWKLLLEYLPPRRALWPETLTRKRAEYDQLQRIYYGNSSTNHRDEGMLRQIRMDVPRSGHTKIGPDIQERMVRVLYCWCIRRPAAGYVQGLNDVLLPFFLTFSSSMTTELDGPGSDECEADCFWCFGRLVDDIQDHYTPKQDGLMRLIANLRAIGTRTYPSLVQHLDQLDVHFVQFAFRWMNCLLIRELPLRHIIRMWDTYLSEDAKDPFGHGFHVWVCAALLGRFERDVLEITDFGEAMLFLQKMPCDQWTLRDIEMLLSEAYALKHRFLNKQGSMGI